jgi:TP901 family phage tail tape measure protein
MISEAIEILATIKGIDLVSGVLDRVSGSFDEMAETAQTAADAAAAAAAKIDESLLTTASGADALTLATAQVDGARTQLAAATEKQAVAERNLIQAQEASAASADTDTTAQAALIKATQALADARKVTTDATNDMDAAEARLAATVDATTGASVVAAREGVAASEAQAAAASEAGDASAEGSEKAKTAAFVAAAVVAGIGYEAVKSAMSFETLTTRLVTTAGESQSALASVRQGILAVSDQTGVSADTLAQSMYVVESAGFHGAAGLDVLKASTQGAATEGADFNSVANAVTDILKDYHHSASDAANVTSQLTAAVSVGKGNFQTMSSAMGNVLPLASAVGLKFNDVAGALAEMTSHGVTAQRASQNLATVIRSLEKPTTVMQTEFKAVGITTDELNQHMSKQGLGGTLEWLSQTAASAAPKLNQTYTGALGSLVGTAAGLNVALETTGKNAKDTASDIATIGKSSADANGNVKGFSDLQKTTAFQLQRAEAAVKNVGIAIGTDLLPFVTKAATELSNILVPIMKWISTNKTLVVDIVEVAAGILTLVGVLKAVSLATDLFAGALDLITESPIIAAITAIVLVIIYCYTHFKTFRDIVNEVMRTVGTIIVQTGHAIGVAFNAVASAAVTVWHALETAWNAVAGAAKALWGWLVSIWNDIADVTSTVWNAISGFFEKWWPLLFVIFAAPIALLVGLWNRFHNDLFSFAKTVWHNISSFFSSTWHTIMNVAQDAWNLLEKYVLAPMRELWQQIQPIIHTIESFLSGAWNDILGVVKGAWALIKHFIIQPIEEAWNQLSSWIIKFNQIGEDIINGIITGLKKGWSWLTGTVSHLAKDALDAAKSVLDIGSPSKKFADEVGKWIPHGIAMGIDQNAQVAHNAVKKLGAALTATAKTSVSGTLATTGSFTLAGGASAGAAGPNGMVVNIDLRGAQVMSNQDIDLLSRKIEKRLATVTLPSGGYRSKF